MNAIILSAGMGTRVGNHTSVTPKCMLDILGTNILEIQVKQLKMMGINDIFVIGGHYAHKINNPHIKVILNKSYKTTNMFFSLMCARDILEDDVVISYGDIIYFSKILESLITDDRKDIVIADTNWKEYWMERYGQINYDLESFKITDEYISDIGNSEININQIDARYIGLMKFSKNTIDQMIDFYNKNIENKTLAKIKMMYLTDIIQYLVTQKKMLIPVKKIYGGWCEIDTSYDYSYAKKFFRTNQHQIVNNEII
tara:strand:+ start:817 stop:1584 length:768 start_codon:yes stop_codon:yes gene_type:complete